MKHGAGLGWFWGGFGVAQATGRLQGSRHTAQLC